MASWHTADDRASARPACPGRSRIRDRRRWRRHRERLGLEPLTDEQRRELLAGVNLFDALETVARLQGRWDVAYTTTQRVNLVEAAFLAVGTGQVCRRARQYVVNNRDFIVSPRASAQLQREIIEYASADEAAPSIDLDMVVHMLLSITSEQNMRPEFAGDVPTDAEVAKLP